jgi:hypothetical protein
LFDEVAKHGQFLNNTEYTRSQQPYFSKKKSVETRAREAQEKRATSRKNICSTCHMAMPLGTKECENCE